MLGVATRSPHRWFLGFLVSGIVSTGATGRKQKGGPTSHPDITPPTSHHPRHCKASLTRSNAPFALIPGQTKHTPNTRRSALTAKSSFQQHSASASLSWQLSSQPTSIQPGGGNTRWPCCLWCPPPGVWSQSQATPAESMRYCDRQRPLWPKAPSRLQIGGPLWRTNRSDLAALQGSGQHPPAIQRDACGQHQPQPRQYQHHRLRRR